MLGWDGMGWDGMGGLVIIHICLGISGGGWGKIDPLLDKNTRVHQDRMRVLVHE